MQRTDRGDGMQLIGSLGHSTLMSPSLGPGALLCRHMGISLHNYPPPFMLHSLGH